MMKLDTLRTKYDQTTHAYMNQSSTGTQVDSVQVFSTSPTVPESENRDLVASFIVFSVTTDSHSNCWEACTGNSKLSIATVVSHSSPCSSCEASTNVSCVVACCTGSSDERSNCWEALSSKLSIVPKTTASAWLVTHGSSPSRSCNAYTNSFSILSEGSKLLAKGPSNASPIPSLNWIRWFSQRGPEAWRNDSIIHHGTFVRSDTPSKIF